MEDKSKLPASYYNRTAAFVKSELYSAKVKFNEGGLLYLLKDKKVLISILVISFLLIIIFSLLISSKENNIPVYQVKQGNFLVSLMESGEIQAKNATSISAPRIRGNLKIVYLVPEGTYVQAGDTVVIFDQTEAITNLKDAESKLEISLSDKRKLAATQESEMTSLKSALKSAELSYELSKLNLEQMKFEAEVKQQEAALNHEKNELSYEKAKQDLESKKIIHQSEMNKMDVEIQQKKADLEKAERDVSLLTLTAPKEGLAVYGDNWSTGRKVSIGDTPWPGMGIIILPDLSHMESKVYINEVDVSKIKEGLKVYVTLDAFRDSTFEGIISNVASLGTEKERGSKVKVFEVKVDILSKSNIIKPGMTTSNEIIINQVPNVIYIPQEAVFENEGKEIAYIKNGSGFDAQEIKVGEKSTNYIIVKNGIEEGSEVALIDPTLETNIEGNLDESGKPSVNLPVSSGK